MPGVESAPRTLYDKVLGDHIVDEKLDGTLLLYIGESQQVVAANRYDFKPN